MSKLTGVPNRICPGILEINNKMAEIARVEITRTEITGTEWTALEKWKEGVG